MASRRLESAVPIWLKVVTIWVDEVSRKNLLLSLAQFCSSVEVALAHAVDRSEVGREIDRIKAKRGESTSDIGELEMDRPPQKEPWMQ